MAIDPKHIGRKYGPFRYTLGVEKMREFALAVAGGVPSVGFTDLPRNLHPLLFDERAAEEGPYGEVIAFPTFAVLFAMAPFGRAVTDPELGIDLKMLLHGEQEFEFLEVMRAGDVMETTGTITGIYEKAGKDFMVVVTESRNQHGRLAVRGTWTAVIRR